MTITLLSTAATALTAVVNIGACIAVASVKDRIPDGTNDEVVPNPTAAMTACSRLQGGQGGRVKGHSIMAEPRVPTSRLIAPMLVTPVRTMPISMIHTCLPAQVRGNGTLG